MPDPDGSGERLALSAQLSHLLVAFTVELDNEFEHLMPHRTTRHGSTGGRTDAPWLVSYPMWVHCLRYIPDDGIRADDLVRRSGLTATTMRTLVKRLAAWWGYLTVSKAGEAGGSTAAARVVRLSAAGQQARDVWRPLEAEIEARWCGRFGATAIGTLRDALAVVAGQLELELPDYLPLGEPRLRTRRAENEMTALGLPGLVSKVLLALALDFEQQSDLELGIYTADHVSRLAITANVLRALDDGGVRVSALPARTGVAKMAVDNWIGILGKRGYVETGPDPAGGRFRVATPTGKGQRARMHYERWASDVAVRFADRFATDLRTALDLIARDEAAVSVLLPGMRPYPDGWRAQLPAPTALPDYPVLSLRGGFPDGS